MGSWNFLFEKFLKFLSFIFVVFTHLRPVTVLVGDLFFEGDEEGVLDEAVILGVLLPPALELGRHPALDGRADVPETHFICCKTTFRIFVQVRVVDLQPSRIPVKVYETIILEFRGVGNLLSQNDKYILKIFSGQIFPYPYPYSRISEIRGFYYKSATVAFIRNRVIYFLKFV